MTGVVEGLRRLAARGDWKAATRADGEVSLRWWPHGQRGNPFCGWAGHGRDLAVLVEQALAATRPPFRSVDDLVAAWQVRRARDAGQLPGL